MCPGEGGWCLISVHSARDTLSESLFPGFRLNGPTALTAPVPQGAQAPESTEGSCQVIKRQAAGPCLSQAGCGQGRTNRHQQTPHQGWRTDTLTRSLSGGKLLSYLPVGNFSHLPIMIIMKIAIKTIDMHLGFWSKKIKVIPGTNVPPRFGTFQQPAEP